MTLYIRALRTLPSQGASPPLRAAALCGRTFSRRCVSRPFSALPRREDPAAAAAARFDRLSDLVDVSTYPIQDHGSRCVQDARRDFLKDGLASFPEFLTPDALADAVRALRAGTPNPSCVPRSWRTSPGDISSSGARTPVYAIFATLLVDGPGP